MTLQKQREGQSKQIIQAEIKERERISEDLHDSLGQILAMIKLHLSKLHQKCLNQSLEKSQEQSQKSLELVDTAITELRAISHAMSPLLLHKKGLADSIRDISKNISNQCNCTIDVDIIGLKDNNMLTEYTIYRVVQEAFNNIIKHAKATKVELQVLQNDEEINVMIEDNGIGFMPDIQQGMGIKTMRNRVENTGGSFNIDSLEGRGSIINFSLPPTNNISDNDKNDNPNIPSGPL
jgi:signal transduction histidine kinase